jgi:hypothetical protein
LYVPTFQHQQHPRRRRVAHHRQYQPPFSPSLLFIIIIVVFFLLLVFLFASIYLVLAFRLGAFRLSAVCRSYSVPACGVGAVVATATAPSQWARLRLAPASSAAQASTSYPLLLIPGQTELLRSSEIRISSRIFK